MDISESIRRVLNEEYILYHMGHYNQIVRDKADGYFSDVFTKSKNSTVNSVLDAQVQAIVKSMKTQGKQAVGAVELLNALGNGKLLEELLEDVAGALDVGIQSAWSSGKGDLFAGVLKDAYSYADLFQGGNVDIARVQSFFDLVVQGIQIMTGGGVPQEVFTQLTDIGQQIVGSNFSYTGSVVSVTEKQLQVAKKALDYLATAARKLSSTGEVSVNSFRATIKNMFNTVLGEEVGRQMLESAMPNLDNEIVKISNKVFNGNANVKLMNTSFQTSGQNQLQGSTKTAKVDVLNNQALSLSLLINGTVTTIDLATNINVKWYKANDKGVIPRVSLGQMQLGDLLHSPIFSTAARGMAYNVLAHSWADPVNMKYLRSTLGASFIDQWISGSGGLTKAGNVDKAQFILINGKLYSIPTVIRMAMDAIPYGVGKHPITVQFNEISKNQNRFEPMLEGENDPWIAAERRSRLVQGLINNLAVSANLNINMLGLNGRYT